MAKFKNCNAQNEWADKKSVKKRTFTCLLKQCKHKHNTSLAKITKYFEHLAYISTTELK